MSRLNTLHLHDLEAQADPKVESGRNRLVATILTAGIVVLGGSALFVLAGDDPPRSLPSESAVGSVPSAPADASSETAPVTPAELSTAEQVGSMSSAIPKVATLTVPAGTSLVLEIAEPMPSDGAVVGTEIVAVLATPIMVEGEVAAAAGSRVVGRVTETTEVGDEGPSAVVGIAFDRIEVGSEPTPIAAALQGVELDLAPGRRLELQLSSAVEFPVAAEREG